jgi:hypothetical protein
MEDMSLDASVRESQVNDLYDIFEPIQMKS